MKNVIPIVVAVVLGLAAVYAVSRTMADKDDRVEKNVAVVASSRGLQPRDVLTEALISPRVVSVNALPAQHITWENRNMILGQQMLNSVSRGDYILLSDVGLTRSKGQIVGDGEWGVPVSFADATLVKMLQAGDEIAIVASYNVVVREKVDKNVDAAPQEIRKNVTSVLFPR